MPIPDFLKAYRDIMLKKVSFEDVADRHDIRYVVTSQTGMSPTLLRHLYKSRNWRLVYFDGIASMFARNSTENRKVLASYRNLLTEPTLSLSPSDIEQLRQHSVYPFLHLARSCFYRDSGAPAYARKEIEHALLISPGCGECYYALGELYRQGGAYRDALQAYAKAMQNGYNTQQLRRSLAIVQHQ
jgi:tetratricopeptide (TPR) repeat protein